MRAVQRVNALIVALSFTFGVASTVQAAASVDAPVTPATTIHGAPGNTPGFGGNSANPQGNGVNGGNCIHAIAGAPGQGGTSGAGNKDPPGCDMHGGLNNYNQNCD